MAGAPTLQLLLDNGTGTFPHDISSRIRKVDGWDISNRGRTDEQTEATSGQLTITLNNKDGALTPGSTVIASPSPVVADQLVRLKLTVGATTVNRFTGRLQGDVASWPGGKALALVTITVTDNQAVLERRTLRSYIEEEILQDGPKAHYTLGEPAGSASAADSSGNQEPVLTVGGSGADVVFGTATGPETDGLTAVTFGGGKFLSRPSPIANWAVELWFNTTTNDATQRVLLHAGSGLFVYLQNGHLFLDPGANDLGPAADGVWHHAFFGPVYLDGVSGPGGAGHITSPSGDIYLGNSPTLGVGAGFIGSAAHLAMHSTPVSLSAGRIAAHYSAGKAAQLVEAGSARLTRLAGYADVPLGALDASLTNVAFKDITGQSAADAIRDAAAAELGIAYIDGSGSLVFHNRNRVPVKTAPDIIIPAEALSPGTTVPTDMQGIVNYLEASSEATGVTQVVWNKVSELGDGTATHPGHGRYPDQVSYLVQTDAEALDRGNWIVANHAEPQARVGTLEIDVFAQTSAIQQALLAAEPDTWIRVTGLPSQMPGGTTADLIVQGWSEKGSTTEWKLTANVVSRSLYTPVWILGDPTYSVLGSTTRLYV